MGVIHKIGRRKTAVARVYVSEGTGVITVNKKNSQLTSTATYSTVMQPMSMTENATNFDVK
jgi:small subunit ribosomal protein S9